MQPPRKPFWVSCVFAWLRISCLMDVGAVVLTLMMLSYFFNEGSDRTLGIYPHLFLITFVAIESMLAYGVMHRRWWVAWLEIVFLLSIVPGLGLSYCLTLLFPPPDLLPH